MIFLIIVIIVSIFIWSFVKKEEQAEESRLEYEKCKKRIKEEQELREQKKWAKLKKQDDLDKNMAEYPISDNISYAQYEKIINYVPEIDKLIVKYRSQIGEYDEKKDSRYIRVISVLEDIKRNFKLLLAGDINPKESYSQLISKDGGIRYSLIKAELISLYAPSIAYELIYKEFDINELSHICISIEYSEI